MEYAWTSSDTSIVELVVTGPAAGSRVRAIAHAEGHATIRVAGPAVSTTLEIEVQP